MAALMMLIGLVAFFAMPKDIFPAVDIPEINLVWYYPGMSAPEMEQRIVNITERAASQTVNGIDHIESTSFTGIGVVKIYMQEGSSTALGISQLNSVTSAIRNILPQGIVSLCQRPLCTTICSTSSGFSCLPNRVCKVPHRSGALPARSC
jgi:multidrug efflux pump subunit AcrB